MKYKVSKGYFELCRYYGWKATWEGLKAFEKGQRAKALLMIGSKEG